ncbi:hypothetical protein OAM69_06430 [bacterium]|nr:hypothetical protein [bacterium]
MLSGFSTSWSAFFATFFSAAVLVVEDLAELAVSSLALAAASVEALLAVLLPDALLLAAFFAVVFLLAAFFAAAFFLLAAFLAVFLLSTESVKSDFSTIAFLPSVFDFAPAVLLTVLCADFLDPSSEVLSELIIFLPFALTIETPQRIRIFAAVRFTKNNAIWQSNHEK